MAPQAPQAAPPAAPWPGSRRRSRAVGGENERAPLRARARAGDGSSAHMWSGYLEGLVHSGHEIGRRRPAQLRCGQSWPNMAWIPPTVGRLRVLSSCSALGQKSNMDNRPRRLRGGTNGGGGWCTRCAPSQDDSATFVTRAPIVPGPRGLRLSPIFGAGGKNWRSAATLGERRERNSCGRDAPRLAPRRRQAVVDALVPRRLFVVEPSALEEGNRPAVLVGPPRSRTQEDKNGPQGARGVASAFP